MTYPVPQISWSGCKDSQTSADTVEAGQATGAMSHVGFFFHYASLVANPSDVFEYQAFITVLSQNKNLSYQQLLNGIRDILKSKYSQKPQLASSHPIVSRGVCDSSNGG